MERWRRWTKEENEKLKELRDNYTIIELAEMFGVTKGSMYNKIQKLGLRTKDRGNVKVNGAGKVWTEEENEKIRQIREKHTIIELAKMFGVSKGAMYGKLKGLGLRTKDFLFDVKVGKRWTEEENERIKKLRDIYTIVELAEIFKVSKTSIHHKLRRLGLKSGDFHEELPEGFKRCSKCREIFPLENFPANKTSKDGHHCYCKLCSRVLNKVKIKKDKEIDEIKEEKLKIFIEKYKDQKFFCKNCNKEKTLDDYYITFHRGSCGKHCKECDRRRKERDKAQGKLR